MIKRRYKKKKRDLITEKKRKIIVTPLVQAVKHVPPPTLQASAILVLKLGLSSSPVHVISLRTTPTFLLQVCVILPILWREPSGVSAYKKAIVKMIDGDRECPFRPEWITKLNSPMNETLRYSFLFSFHFFFFFFFFHLFLRYLYGFSVWQLFVNLWREKKLKCIFSSSFFKVDRKTNKWIIREIHECHWILGF